MEDVSYTDHAFERIFERGIRRAHIHHVLREGETIREYPDDEPHASELILGWIEDEPLHVVAAYHEGTAYIITAYWPDPDLWTDNFTTPRDNE